MALLHPFSVGWMTFPDVEIHTALLHLFVFFKPFEMAGKTAQEPQLLMVELEQNIHVLKCHSRVPHMPTT